MDDSQKTGSGSGGANQPREMSMEVRLLLAFILMGVVMLVTPYFFKPPVPPKPTTPAQTAQTASAPSGTTPDSAPSQPAPAAPTKNAAPAKKSAPAPNATIALPLPRFIVDTSLFRVVFDNQGATVRSWILKKYKGNDEKPLDLVNPTPGFSYPFSFYFPQGGPQPTSDINWTYYTQTPDPDGLGATFTYSDGRTTARKVFRFEKNSYLFTVSTDVAVDDKPIPALIAWRCGFGDLTVGAPAANEKTVYYSLTDNKLVEQRGSSAKNGPLTNAGDFSFASLGDNYFAAVFLPDKTAAMQQVTFPDTVATPFDPKKTLLTGAAFGDGLSNHFRVFVGPKDYDLLKSIDPKLEQVVDFGWLAFFAKPLFLVVNWFNHSFVHNFGWSIVLVTIALNVILFPLRLSNMKSMRKMQALKPQIDAIGLKYKNVGLRDPKKADQNQEVMDLYKKHGVNPMGGCFPMLIQLPFFIAFYKVFTVSVEMRGANWLWITDLSQPEHLAIRVLPILMIVSQIYMQKMTPQTSVDPSQQRMMMFMPLIFGVMFYNFASGLVLYYLTSNLVSMAQQLFFNHTEAAVEAARSVEPPKKKNGRK